MAEIDTEKLSRAGGSAAVDAQEEVMLDKNPGAVEIKKMQNAPKLVDAQAIFSFSNEAAPSKATPEKAPPGDQSPNILGIGGIGGIGNGFRSSFGNSRKERVKNKRLGQTNGSSSSSSEEDGNKTQPPQTRTAAKSIDGKKLYRYVRDSLNHEEEFHFLRFESLLRLNLAQYELELMELRSKIERKKNTSEVDMKALGRSIRRYTSAVRDYQFLTSKKALSLRDTRTRKLLLQRYFQSPGDHEDPFNSHYYKFQEENRAIDPLRAAVMRYFPKWLTWTKDERKKRGNEFKKGRVPPKEVSNFVDMLVQFSVSILGGLFLIVPMLIMTLGGQTQKKSLITVSVAVVLFVLVMAFGVRMPNDGAIVATATYAAVLVVFLGASNGAGSG